MADVISHEDAVEHANAYLRTEGSSLVALPRATARNSRIGGWIVGPRAPGNPTRCWTVAGSSSPTTATFTTCHRRPGQCSAETTSSAPSATVMAVLVVDGVRRTCDLGRPSLGTSHGVVRHETQIPGSSSDQNSKP